MKIEVRFTGIDASDALHAYVVRRIHFRLSRFDGEVGSVVVRIADVNGPKGGADKRCHVLVRGRGLGRVTVEELSADAYSAVDRAIERGARAVARGLGRGRGIRRLEGAFGRAS
jgi:ribosomal subunit interface protein